MTTRIFPIELGAAAQESQQLLNGVQKTLGMTPNMMRTIAHSPAALEGYLAFGKALSKGVLPPGFREEIALTVAQQNGCDYCLSAHTALGQGAGLTQDDIHTARGGRSRDPKREAGLRFAQEVVRERGRIADDSLARVRQAGHTDREITEIVAHIALNVFTNYFNLTAETEIDFPPVTAETA